MAKKQFSEMTHGEKYKYYRKRQYACVAGKWTAIISPFIIVFGCKFNEYIKIIDTGETIKLTLGCILAVVVAAIAIYKEVKHSDETKHMAPALGWGVALAFIWLFQTILKDLTLIVGSEFAGQMAAWGISLYGNYAKEEAIAYKDLARKDGSIAKESKFSKIIRASGKAIKVKIVKNEEGDIK